jgi:hypothetical protein
MENLIFLFATSFVLRIARPGKFRNYLIGESGCSALFLTNSNKLESVLTKTGDKLYAAEFKEHDVHYGIICINLNQVYDKYESEALLQNYLNKLQQSFKISHNIGIKQAVNWNCPESISYVDYWQDYEKRDWKIRGYINGEVMAILYVKNIGKADVKRQDLFLESFHFRRK